MLSPVAGYSQGFASQTQEDVALKVCLFIYVRCFFFVVIVEHYTVLHALELFALSWHTNEERESFPEQNLPLFLIVTSAH